ncbi:MAG TPA: hypothetical protein VK638_25620, partial [Edaphobacter sp.]|nr:hypothetical protein [Edaphobacter sp.]
RGLPLIQLTQGQGAQGRAYPLQPASQQLIDLLRISLLEFNSKSYASVHSSVIQPMQALEKCLHWLLIYAVTVLVLLLSLGKMEWFLLLFPLWVLLISVYILIDNLHGRSVAAA